MRPDSIKSLFLAALLLFASSSAAFSASCSFSWLPNSETTLAGYRIHYGTASRQYSQSVNVGKPAAVNGRITATITGLNDGTSHFTAATAYDTSGNQSGYSTEVICSTPAANGQPTAKNSSFTVQENSTYSGRLTGTDPNNDPLVYTLVSQAKNGSVTLNNDGTFTYKDSSTTASTDSFTFTVNDGKSTSAPATVSVTISPAGTLPIEVGEVRINHSAVQVRFSRQFSQPVVIAQIVSRNDAAPCVVRINSVNSTGFTIRLKEWDYLNNVHAYETVSYMVMEKGTYTLANGAKVEAGTFATSKTTATPFTFARLMSKKPIILTSIVTINETDAVTGRINNISTKGFSYKLQEQEKNTQTHATETIAYIAWEPGSNTQGGVRYTAKTVSGIDHNLKTVSYGQTFTVRPFVLGGMQTTGANDPSTMRVTTTSTTALTTFIEEEQSKDIEVKHGLESIGFLAISL